MILSKILGIKTNYRHETPNPLIEVVNERRIIIIEILIPSLWRVMFDLCDREGCDRIGRMGGICMAWIHMGWSRITLSRINDCVADGGLISCL